MSLNEALLQAQRRAEQDRAARKRDQPPSPVLKDLLEVAWRRLFRLLLRYCSELRMRCCRRSGVLSRTGLPASEISLRALC